MKGVLGLLLIMGITGISGAQLTRSTSLPGLSEAVRFPGDYLVQPCKLKAQVFAERDTLILDNGLIRRVLYGQGGSISSIGLYNVTSGESLLRCVKPEAQVTINGKEYSVGGMSGQPDLAFLLPEWLPQMKVPPQTFLLTGYQVGLPSEPVPWVRKRHSEGASWPPKGVELTLRFAKPELEGVQIEIVYSLYEGMPVLRKQLRLINRSPVPIKLERVAWEVLGLAEAQSEVDTYTNWQHPNVDLLSDYSFGGMSGSAANRTMVWEADSEYGTQVNYELKTPCVLKSQLPVGPGEVLEPGATFETPRSYLLLYDSTDRERRGLAVRKFYRMFAPWTTESPLMLHLTTIEEATAKRAMDQAHECGFEMVIFSFGSGLNAEDISEANIRKIKALVDYGHSKDLEVGCYSLLASRRIDDANDAINPKTGKPGGAIFGNSPCLCSAWGQKYFENLRTFLERTGMDLLEHDGNYPGDVCASINHPGHNGLEDSQFKQWRAITDLYRWCRSKGIYLNVPDWYVLAGSNKTGMGYRETNWSLPRSLQHVHARQNMYDGTWTKLPTCGWMFVPLTQYHGGGEAATMEPLSKNLKDYEQHLKNCLSYGVQACYRGPRLYDTDETKAAVLKWVNWFKLNRDVLESDVIHLKRPNGVSLDAILHVQPKSDVKAMLVVHNPTERTLTEEFLVPLYYTGLKSSAVWTNFAGKTASGKLDGQQTVRVTLTVPPRGMETLLFRQ